MKRVKWNTESFIFFLKELHNNFYDYSKVVYKTLHDNIIIICPVHGEFIQLANHHKNGHGCPKCAVERQHNSQRDTTEIFIEKSINRFGDLYDYSIVKYGKNAISKVDIICKKHGVFKISPNIHLRGCGCPKCGTEKILSSPNRYHSWSKTNWRKRCEGKIAKLYIIRIFNDNESFYKVGITSKNNIKRRFTKLPYSWELIHLIESDNPDYIFDLERKILRETKDSKYLPLIKFEGYTECRINLSSYAACH